MKLAGGTGEHLEADSGAGLMGATGGAVGHGNSLTQIPAQ